MGTAKKPRKRGRRRSGQASRHDRPRCTHTQQPTARAARRRKETTTAAKTITTAAGPANLAEHSGCSDERTGRQSSSSWAEFNDASLRGTETVLLVSDTNKLLSVMAGLLRGLGYRVLEALNGLEAQKLAALEPKIDLLLADLSQPDTNLLDLAVWFRATYSETRVLVASSSFWDLHTQLALLREVSLLPKPFTPHELALMVRRVLD
jgi:CheY-like chemotaxis protein